MTGSADWLRPFTPAHAEIVAAILVWGALVIFLGARLRASGPDGLKRELTYRRLLGAAGVLFALAYNVWWLTPPNYDPAGSLPLHICDVMIVMAPVSMLFRARWLKTLAYFWGIGLSTQALVTPVETAGPGSTRFWLFWLGHTQIIGIAVYHVVVSGYRPRLRDVLEAIGMGLIYLAVVLVVNASIKGANYGYLGDTRDTPGLVKLLGPWPLRILWMCLLAILAFVIVWAPWPIAARLRDHRA